MKLTLGITSRQLSFMIHQACTCDT